jgi:hypothetical protein
MQGKSLWYQGNLSITYARCSSYSGTIGLCFTFDTKKIGVKSISRSTIELRQKSIFRRNSPSSDITYLARACQEKEGDEDDHVASPAVRWFGDRNVQWL